MELSNNTVLDYKVIIRIFVILVIMYFVYSMTYTPSTSILTLPMSIQDSPYISPEGWPLPYPYVPTSSN
jgi:hypothetical protein